MFTLRTFCFAVCGWFPTGAFSCDWDEIRYRVGTLGHMYNDQSGIAVAESPELVRQACCLIPDWDNRCWDSTGDGSLPRMYIECCFEEFKQQLHSDIWPNWLEAEVIHAFRHVPYALTPEHRTKMSEEVEAHQLKRRLNNTKPCRYEVRDGELQRCDDASACWMEPTSTNDCSYLQALDFALDIVHTLKPFPDGIEFHVSPGERDLRDWPMPVLARHFSKATRTVIGFPMEWQLHPLQIGRHNAAVKRKAWMQRWDDRTEKLLWRGTNSYCVADCDLTRRAVELADESDLSQGRCMPRWEPEICIHNSTTWLNSPRSRLVLLTSYLPELVDARFTRTDMVPSDEKWQQWLNKEGLVGEFIPSHDQVQWKYYISMDGTSGQQSHYLQLHMCGVVICQDTPLATWLSPGAGVALQPMVNMMRVRHDLADLVSTLEWLKDHDVEASEIAARGCEFADMALSPHGVLQYVARVIIEYGDRVLRGNKEIIDK